MSMKQLLGLAVFAVVAVAAGSQEIYLVNESGATIYLVDGDVDLAAFDLDPTASYRQIPSGGVLPYEPGTSIAGFGYSRGSFQLPTLAVSEADLAARARLAQSDRTYLPIEPADLTTERIVSPSAFADLLSMPRVDDQYLDWVGREAAVARGRSRAPLGVYADFGDGREPVELDDSLLWQRGGTDLQWLKTTVTRRDYYLGVSVYTAFARGTTVFLYIYDPDDDIPVATIELPAWQKQGFVLLWTPTQPQPRVVGNLVASEFFLEAQIWRGRIDEIVGTQTADLVVEISTASSAAGLWEEFVLARDDFGLLFAQ